MRILLGLLLMLSPAFAIYKGVEERGHAGFSRYLVNSEVEGRHYCSGILIAKDIIATTAICAMAPVTLQKWYYRTKTGQKTEVLPVHSILHPQYDPTKSYWTTRNISLIRLSKPVNPELPELFKTLTTYSYEHNEMVTLAGFGRTENENALSAGVFRSASLPLTARVHSFAEASQQLQPLVIPSDAPIASVCAGDQGGGLFIRKENKDILIGMLIGAVQPKDTVPNTCGGQSLVNHMGNIKEWIEKSVDILRAREIKK